MKKSLPFIIIGVVLVGGVIALFAFTRGRGTGDNNQTFVQNSQPAQLANNAPAPPQGSPDNSAGLTKPDVKVTSPVILEEYGDYQCPPCGALHPVLKQLEHEYGTQLRVVFRHFPLAKIHPNAIAAARAAEAARNQGKFTQMHDQLYRNQNAWKDLTDPRATFIGYASGLGLNVERLTRDMESVEVEQRIAADMQKGSSVGVTGTPTVFIDGRLLSYEHMSLGGLRQAINIMLQRKAAS